MLKKVLLTIVVSACLASVSFAEVYVSWRASGGFYFNADINTGILGPGDSTLAQLIWRPDDSGPLQGTDAANVNNPNYVSGDDVWLADYTVTEGVNAQEWANFNAGAFSDGGVQPNGGYVYARIFESDNINVGTHYYVGPVMAVNNLDSSDPLTLPDSYQMNRDTNLGDPIDAGAFSFQVVPEPGTMILLTLGIATLGGAAHKRRKAAVVEA